jgi:uncharacterized iron-regulated protein
MKCVLIVLFAALGCAAQQSPATPSGSSTAAAKPAAITPQHYRVYNSLGWSSSIDEIVAMADGSRVVFLGESHDDPVAHYLEAELLKRITEKYKKVALSMEMFERDVQPVMNEYLAGLISEDQLISAGRAWRNYRSDYKPMVDFAKQNKLPVIAANAPRRYVNRVGRNGADSLSAVSEEAKNWLPPLPYYPASKEYRARFVKVMEEGRKEAEEARKKAEEERKKAGTAPAPKPAMPAQHPTEPDMEKTLAAQSLWDATMAFSVADYLTRNPDSKVVHVNGRFHSERRLGAVEHLNRYRGDARPIVVSIVPDKGFPNFDAKEMQKLGDFVIVTDANLPRSYADTPGQR